MIVVDPHVPSCVYCAFDCFPHGSGAVVQHLRDSATVRFERPLLLRQFSGELGGVLENEYQTDEVDMCERLTDAWACLRGLYFEPTLRKGSEQVNQNGVVPVPRIQQNVEQALILRIRHS